MSTAELKKKIISEINDIDNEDLLLEVYQLLETEHEAAALYPLSEDQLSAIRKSQDQIKKGQFVTEEDANKEIDEWLEK